MSAKTPIRTVFDDDNNATGLAEYQSGEFIGLTHGGLGASLSIGSAGQVLKVNSGASALEFGTVEAVLNIDGMTDGTSITVASTDQVAISDGGTEKRINVSQLGPGLAGVPASAVDFSSATITGITSITSGGITISGNQIISADSSIIDFGESVRIDGDLTVNSNDITLTTNTSGNILVADGSKFSSKAVSELGAISTIASDDVLLAVDTSGGGLKKVARSVLVSGLATSSAISNIVEDSTPQLGGDLDVNSNDIVSTSNANIQLLPNGSGKVNLDGNGSSGGVSVTDGLIEIRTGTGSVAEQRFYCESSNAHYTSLKSAAHSTYSGNVTLTLPVITGTLATQSFSISQAIALG